MTADAHIPDGSSRAGDPGPSDSVRRTAFYLGGVQGPLFAWLHRSGEACDERHGVVVCPPIGYEQLHAHRSLRHLADAIASAGFPVLRIDYHGTGDSSGCDEDPDRVDTWTADIRAAAKWLREELGCRRVSLCGLRVGATLAVLAATQEEFSDLVLWAPVVQGRLYVREMRAVSRASLAATPAARDSSGFIEACGFRLSQQTAESLDRVSLLEQVPNCRRLLIVSRDDSAPNTGLREHLTQHALAVEEVAQSGYTDMMAVPHETRVPQPAIHLIADWLSQGAAADGGVDTASPPRDTDELPSRDAAPDLPDSVLVGPPDLPPRRLQLCRISEHPDLFGILTAPATEKTADRPLVILLNAGSAYRIGPGRLHVLLARRLAAAGFASLRMDACGLGDSVQANRAGENNPYAATVFRDIALAIKFLHDRYGTRRVVLVGICSGAYAAFQFAAQVPEPLLVESLLINPVTYYWKDGMTIDDSGASKVNTWLSYTNSALQPDKWMRLLTGQSQLGVWGTLREFFHRVGLWEKSAAKSAIAPPSGGDVRNADCEYGHPAKDDLPGDLERVARSGRQLGLFFASTDPGYLILKVRAGRSANRLRRAGRLSVRLIENVDHTFSAAEARTALIEAVLDHLTRRYPDSESPRS